MSRRYESESLTGREAFSLLTVDDLKPLVALVGKAAGKKGDLVKALADLAEDPKQLRSLYASLDDIGQKAVQEAAHHPDGVLDEKRFRAKYGRWPNFGGSRLASTAPPSALRLLFPRHRVLPTDIRKILLKFVPEPPPLTVDARDDLPAAIKVNDDTSELRIRQTSRTAAHDLIAVLRLIDAGEVKVSDKSRRPSQASAKAIAGVLSEGDFYTDGDQPSEDWDPAHDLTIQAFAWPMLLQAAGLAEAAGTRLQLTPAGRKATTRPAHEVIRQVWERWQKTTLLDEFNRVSVIKGQQGKGHCLTAVASRRNAVVEVLADCPVRKWIAVEELFRLLKVLPKDFVLTHSEWKLYICEQQYGSFGYEAEHTWETLEGRFVLAFLFEYAATLGLLDVAYVPPEGARNDFYDRGGTDDLSCLSRYDGLMYVRINPLGAWVLGPSDRYEPEAMTSEKVLRVLPNHDIVVADKPLSRADALLLERFADRKSDAVWHLDVGKILEAVERSMSVGELIQFLSARSVDPLPQTVEVFLQELQGKAGQLEDQGTARLIACKDAIVATTLANDRRLRKVCQLSGERHLVFRSADEAAVRRGLKELGYVLPPPKG